MWNLSQVYFTVGLNWGLLLGEITSKQSEALVVFITMESPCFEEGVHFVSTQCGHIFHLNCLKSWIESNYNENQDSSAQCPLCENLTSLQTLVQLQVVSPRIESPFSSFQSARITLKIAIVGDSGSGKTTLLHTFREGYFQNDINSTCGCDVFFKTLDFSGEIIKLNIWDCGGQDRFAAITPNFLRNVQGLIFVYDITNAQSFENREKWFRIIRNHAPIGAPIILVGNKSDLEDARSVPQSLAQNVADSSGMNFVECSAKEIQSVEVVFRLLVGIIMEQQWRQHDKDFSRMNNYNSIKLSDPTSKYETNHKLAGRKRCNNC